MFYHRGARAGGLATKPGDFPAALGQGGRTDGAENGESLAHTTASPGVFETSGFEVWDLGIDVDLFKFLDKAKEVDADVIAMSALLTTTLVGQRDLIEALEEQGTRDAYKVMVGGGATTQAWADPIGADGWAATAYEAVTLAGRLVA